MRIFTTRIGVVGRAEAKPEDLRDAIATLSFDKKIVVSIRAPGLGPAVLLGWAEAELAEAMAAGAGEEGVAQRKAFTATIISKMAVECLLDWYLDSSYLGFTLRPHAGTEEKLDALDAEGLLSIGTSLFRDVLFEPRNRAVHNYQGVDLKSAKHAYELARLFIRNAQHAHSPDRSNTYYGTIDFARGEEARRVSRIPSQKGRRNKIRREAQEFYFGGLGATGQHGVFLCRTGTPSLSVLDSCGDGAMDIRYARLNSFSPSLLREVLAMLEKAVPTPYELEAHEQEHVITSLTDAVTGKANGPR